MGWLFKVKYKILVRYEKFILKLHSLNSFMEISTDYYRYLPTMDGERIDTFYNVNKDDVVIYEPMYYQATLDNVIKRVFTTSDREVKIEFKCYAGYVGLFTFKKKRKKVNLEDYIKLAYFVRLLIRYAYPQRKYKVLIKQACKVACKERKVREKNGYLINKI